MRDFYLKNFHINSGDEKIILAFLVSIRLDRQKSNLPRKRSSTRKEEKTVLVSIFILPII
ncbi:MAG: hypothetical protein CMP11_00685 [Zetaproteobacteria bacterium]|nr:hypothetical protein [Pseudobdellovibrionaceae bacterium]